MLLIYLNLIEDTHNQSRFETLYLRHRKMMYYTAFSILNNKEDAEDAVHNAFIAISKHINNIEDINSNETAAYLHRCAKNSALNLFAKNKRRSQQEFSTNEIYEDISDHDMHNQAVKAEYEKVVLCIENLPEIYKSVLQLHFQYNQTINQTAKTLGIKVSTVKQRLVRGKKMLIEAIKKE